ncbi:MAG: NUDIX hydrolase [Candidatus Dormibacteria bacterium]
MAVRRYAARVVVLDPDNRVLLFNWATKKAGTSSWTTPGGGLEAGEKSREAAIRELREETGIVVASVEGPVWRGDHFFRSGPDLYHQLESFFLARTEATDVDTSRLDEFEAAAYLGHRWWSMGEMEQSTAAIYPRGLAGLLRDLLRDGVPPKVLAIKG